MADSAMRKTLFVSDLDGTFLRGDGTVSIAAKTMLNEMLDNGLHFTVASARSVVSMQPLLDGIAFRLPIIELNGALITDIHTGEHQVINSMRLETVLEVWNHCVRQSSLPII